MGILVLFEKRDGPWGGGNQFLKALESELETLESSTRNEGSSRVLLVNSHHFGGFFPNLRAGVSSGDRVIHRIDGPISSTRRTVQGLISDLLIFLFSTLVADGVVFQSGWSKQETKRLGFRPKRSVVIHNAPNPAIFHPLGVRTRESNPKTRVIVTSWSTNPFKGFEMLEAIATELEGEGFEFRFVGNSFRPLENFVHLPPMDSESLAAQLRDSDLYLSASENDSCSNSLLEAVHCGLVPVVIDSGGNPEIIGVRELIFETVEEAVAILRQGLDSLLEYASKIEQNSLREIAIQYADFATRLSLSSTSRFRRVKLEIFVALHFMLGGFSRIVNALSVFRQARR